MIPNKLGTCCQILDTNGKQYKDTVIGTVKQTTLDRFLYGASLKGNPELRQELINSNTTGVKKCRTKITEKVKQNLSALLLQLKHISKMPDDCKMFRISSNLLPMFDHPEYNVLYDSKLKSLVHYNLKLCKRVIDEYNIVVTCHPDQWNKVCSDKEHVRTKTFAALEYHRYFMEQLTTFDKSCINVHIDGALDHIPEFDQGLYPELRKWLSFENDDTNKNAGVLETLAICQEYNIKMVYDIHHDYCENSGKKYHANDDRIMASIINTWRGQTPIFHVSDSRYPWSDTPKGLSPHSDYIVSGSVISCVNVLLEFAHVEVEAKHKNLAVLNLLDKITINNLTAV